MVNSATVHDYKILRRVDSSNVAKVACQTPPDTIVAVVIEIRNSVVSHIIYCSNFFLTVFSNLTKLVAAITLNL